MGDWMQPSVFFGASVIKESLTTALTPCTLKYTNEFTHNIENPPKP